MTAATAILGLLPILVLRLHGTEIERPLAIVMTGGLITSTVFTLLALPTFYVAVHRLSSASLQWMPALVLYNRDHSERRLTPLDTHVIIAALEAERDRLNQAIAALQRGKTVSGKSDRRRRPLSAAARRRIGLAMKKRWAERKKKAA